MGKLLLVAAPLALYAVGYVARAALGRRPSRHALNVELAVLLTLYFLVTAGLGLFWVANQQLPPFDLHYLFGYATLALFVAHLIFNTRIVLAYFRRSHQPAPSLGRRALVQGATAVAIAASAFFLGMRAGSPRLPSTFSSAGDPSMAAIESYHAMSSHSRRGVVLRAPSVAWGLPVGRYVDRGTLPRVALDAPDTARLEPRDAAEALAAVPRSGAGKPALADVSTIVWATAGITGRRGGYDLRASASSGALFPTEVYVLAYDVEGLGKGVYAYDPEAHALVDLRRTPPDDPRAGFGAAPPALAIVATGVFRRTGQKYRDRAYRYVVADAGHAVGNAMIAAAELGLSSEIVSAFDDGFVAAAVGADGVREGTVALIAMRPGGSPRPAPTAGLFAPAQLQDPGELELGATTLAHAATSLRWIEGPDADHEAIELPQAAPRPVRVLELIGSRRSVRNFRSGALALGDVAGFLATSIGPEPVASRAVRAHVLPHRVEGLGPGSTRFDPRRNRLLRMRSGDLSAASGRVALDQEVIGGSAATIVLTLDRAALAAEGARGYRNGLLEAGIVGARLYLAAAAHGLGGCAVGAFYDQQAGELLGIDLEREWPVHFFGLGAPE